MATTGCTEAEFWMPTKRTALYIEPMALNRSCLLELQPMKGIKI